MLPVRLFRKPPRLPHPLMGGHRLWQMRKVGQQRARIVRGREGKGRREGGRRAMWRQVRSCSFHNFITVVRDGPGPVMHPEISKLRNLPFASVYSFLLPFLPSFLPFFLPSPPRRARSTSVGPPSLPQLSLVNAGLMNERI